MPKPTREDAMNAIKTIISFIGDDPSRPELLKTPERVTDHYLKMFSGYATDPSEILSCTLPNSDNYRDPIYFENIEFSSFCEHHILEFSGTIEIAYIPTDKLISFGRIAKLVECLSKRLQIQERLTKQISDAINAHIPNSGTSVTIRASHKCLSDIHHNMGNSIVKTAILTGGFGSKE